MFECPVEGCSKTFESNFALSGHLRSTKDESHKTAYPDWKASLSEHVELKPIATAGAGPATVNVVPVDPIEDNSVPFGLAEENELLKSELNQYQNQYQRQPMPYYASSTALVEPAQWLHSFLTAYGLNPAFVHGQCSRVERRKQLPSVGDLMSDLQGGSGKKNIVVIRDIADDYDFEVKKYMKQREALTQLHPRHGIPVDREYNGGDFYYDDRRGHLHGGGVAHDGGGYQPAYRPTFQQELQNFVETNRLIQGTGQATANPEMDRLHAEVKEMRDRDAARRDRENDVLRQQLQGQQQTIMEQNNQLRQQEMESIRSTGTTTEADVKLRETDNKFNLESKKLDEGGKTREAIANAVSTGFKQVGQAIFATAQELGSEEKRPMEGFTDTKNMWQSECPFCSTTITAPLSARMLTCHGCGKQLEVTPPTTERQIEKPIEPIAIGQHPLEKPKMKSSIEQREEQPSIEKNWMDDHSEPARVSECIYCKTPLTIPAGLDIIECPKCNKRLRVEAPPDASEIPKEKMPPIEVPPEIPEKEIPIEIPPHKEPVPIEVPPKDKEPIKEIIEEAASLANTEKPAISEKLDEKPESVEALPPKPKTKTKKKKGRKQ